MTEEQAQFVDNMQEVEPAAALATLSNWSANIVVSRLGNLTKSLSYSFEWEYDPRTNDIDKMAMAWSGNYTFYTSSTSWRYRVRATRHEYIFSGNPYYPGFWLNTGPTEEQSMGYGFGYDDSYQGRGVSKDIDIIDYYVDTADQSKWYVNKHMGYLYTEIRKHTTAALSGEVIGRYYHHTSTGSPGTLTFTSQPSITMNGGSYDPSTTEIVNISFYK